MQDSNNRLRSSADQARRFHSSDPHAGRIMPLAGGEFLFIHVVESMPFDVLACDTEGRFILQNRSSRDHFGGLLGCRVDDLAFDAVAIVTWKQLLRRALAGHQSSEEMALDNAGRRRTYQVTLSPLMHEGKVRGAVAVHVDISERKRAELHLREMAFYDHQTGVYNRRAFFTLGEQQLRTARRTDTAAALVFVHVEGVPAINARGGHRRGDEVLSAVANVLCSVFGESDIIARVSGLAFAVLALSRPEADLPNTLNRLHAQIDGYARATPSGGGLSLSVGVTSVSASQETTLDTLFHAARDRARHRSPRDHGQCA